MRTGLNKKQSTMRWAFIVLFAATFFAGTVYSQCYPDNNAYVFFHPAFAGKSWSQTSYDSILIMPFDSLCSLGPSSFDISGSPANATGVFAGRDGNLYLVNSTYSCQGGCVPCQLEYGDPVKIVLSGIAIAPHPSVYLVKNQALYGKDSVKVLFPTAQKQVLCLTLSTADAAVLKQDTLKLGARLNTQEIVRIMGEYDSVALRDTVVWVLGSSGLARRFSLTQNGSQQGSETKRDIGSDTIFCIANGYAGTSSGTIYRNTGAGSFVLDSKPCSYAIMNIYEKGAVGKNGTMLEYTSGVWNYRQIGTADYYYGNFTNRWDGAGVELIDNMWNKTGYTYRDFPSRIATTSPFAYVNNMLHVYNGSQSEPVIITMADPDNSFTDFRLTLKSNFTSIDLKNDGKYSIVNVPGTTLCARDSVRLKDGTIAIALRSSDVEVTAQCMIGKYIPLCQSYQWRDYNFLSKRSWQDKDTVTVLTGTNILKIAYSGGVVSTTTQPVFSLQKYASVSHSMVNGALVFQIRHGTGQKLDRIQFYNIRGQIIASLQVGKMSTISAPVSAASGMIYAKYLFSDGSSSNQSILLIH